MTEKSWPWGGIVTGDASLAPYDDDEWSDIWRQLFEWDRTISAVFPNNANELAITSPSANTARVATGMGMCDGKIYETDANVDKTIATPAVSTRVDLIVLQKEFTAQTVRIAVHAGVEGAGAPTETQTDGTTWETVIAEVSITTGGAITITDRRVFIASTLAQFSSPVWASIFDNATQSVANDADVVATFSGTRVVNDPTGRFWSSTNPDRLTIPKGYEGVYVQHGLNQWAANSTGFRAIKAVLNGAFGADIQLQLASTSPDVSVNNGEIIHNPLVAGDYIELGLRQNRGGALDSGFKYLWIVLMQRTP